MVDMIEAQRGQRVKVDIDGIAKPGIIVKLDWPMYSLRVEYLRDGSLEREWFPADEVEYD